jgi:hypothetical protein
VDASRSKLIWRRLGVVGVLGLIAAAAVWAGTAGTPAFLDATGRLRPALTGVPMIIQPDTDQDLQLNSTGAGSVKVNGTSLPYTPTLQTVCDNDPGDCTLTGLTASSKLVLEGDTAGAARFEIYESGGNMFMDCLQDDDTACNHVFQIATSRKFAIGSASVPDGLNIIAGEPETLDLIERGSDPATPASTRWKAYFKSAGLHIKDDAGAVIGPLDVTASSTSTLTNKTYDVEGTGNTFTIYDELWSDAASCQGSTAAQIWDTAASNVPAATCDTGTNTQKAYLAYDDTTDEAVEMKFRLPTGFTGAIDWVFRWKAAATSGAVGWCVQLIRVPDGATSDPAYPAQASGNCVSDTTKGTTLQENEATISGVTCTSCVAGDLVYARISRDANGGAVTDSMTGDAFLLGWMRRIRRAL